MPYVEGSDVKLYYERYGRGTTPVVLVHGNFASSRWWRAFAQGLPEDLGAYAIDLRGCGRSPDFSEGFDIPQLARDVHGCASALGLVPYHLVGHSLGGAVALQVALDYPGELQTLTLVAPAPADGVAGLKKGGGHLARRMALLDPEDRTSMSVFLAMMRWGKATGATRRRLKRSLQSMMPTAQLERAALAALVDDADRLSPTTVVGFYQALHQWDVRSRLREVKAPVQVIGGAQDPLVSSEALTALVEMLPRAELEIFEDCGHSPQIEAPDRLIERVDSLITAYSWRLRLWRRLGRFLGPRRSGPVPQIS